MELDLKQLLIIARRWWWILLLLPVLCGGLAFAYGQQQTPMYSSSSTIRVNATGSAAQDANAVRVSQDLTETFRQLLVLPPVLDAVVEELDLPYGAAELRTKVTATTVRDTQLIQISVSDPNPEQAARIANTIASTFALYVADESRSLIDSNRSGLDAQIAELETEIASLETQIAELDTTANANNAATQSEIDDLRGQRARFQQQIVDLEVEGQSVGLGLASVQSQVTVASPASPAGAPYEPRIPFLTVLGVFIGVLFAVGLVALLQYLDNSVSSDTNFQDLAGKPILATVSQHPSIREGAHQVFTLAEPRSSAAEAIRLLRANLVFAFAGHDVKTLTVTSANRSEGKSTTSANLAVVMAQAGMKTVLIDADLRKPTQHRVFGTPNHLGLTTLLTDPNQKWTSVAQKVAVPNLSLISSGAIPPNPADLLSIDRFREVLAEIAADNDMVIVDTPPVMAVADPLVVAQRTDAALLVTRAGRTRRDAVRDVVDQLEHANVRLLGVVVNAEKLKSHSYYYYQYEAKDTKGSKASKPNPKPTS